MSRESLTTGDLPFVQEALQAESDAIGRLAQQVASKDADQWTQAIELVAGCEGHVVVSGLGKSGLIGAKISATLSSLGRPSHPAARNLWRRQTTR